MDSIYHEGTLGADYEAYKKAKEFYELSKSFCDYVCNNKIDNSSFKYIIENLMKIYILAINLPVVDVKNTDDEKDEKLKIYSETDIDIDKKTNIPYWTILSPLGEKLSEYDPTPSVFRGDLKDILEDLLYGNVLYEKGKVDYALYEWKNSCFTHWGGNHAMGLFSAIHGMLTKEYEKNKK